MTTETTSDATSAPTPDAAPILALHGAALGFGKRTLWADLDLEVAPGEFLAVLGGNGSGKTSLLRAILGLTDLRAGTISIAGHDVGHASATIGYIPQQRRLDPLTPLRVRDFVRLGLDGHRWGIGVFSRSVWPRVDAALDEAGATHLAPVPIGVLSGGEMQRVRAAQALVGAPQLLLCDEPLLSLDVAAQREITELIDTARRRHGAAVVFVTHEINPVLPYVDRVLYLAGGRFRIGAVDEVFTSATLSELYGAPVEVVRVGGRIIVAGASDDSHHHHHLHNGDDDHDHDHSEADS